MTEVANTESAEPVDASAAEPDDPQAVDASTEEASVDTPDREPSDSGALSASQQANVRRLIQQRDQQWQDWTRQQQNQQTQTASEAAVLDELTTEIRGYYTDDEVGQKTFETIEKHLKKRLGSGERVTMQDVRNVAAQEAGNVRNQVQSGVAITNEVKALVTEGVISTASEQRIVEAEYTARLDDPQMAQAASTPQGAEMILKGVVYDLIKGKKIKPGAKPKAPVNPLSSGGNGSPSRPVKSESLDPSKSPFASVRAMSEDDVKAAANTSHSHFSGAANG
jgi:hypothetical protein